MMESGTSERLTGHEVSQLRETPSALRDAISALDREDCPPRVCPGCGERLSGVPEHGRIEGDWGEEYCSLDCLNKAYNP